MTWHIVHAGLELECSPARRLLMIRQWHSGCCACCKNTSSRMKLLVPFMNPQDVKLVAPPLKPKDPTFTIKDAIILV